MVLAKSKNAVGLGNSLMNDRFGKGRGADRKKVSATGIHRTDTRGNTYVTNEKEEAAWMKMRSVTEQGALDEFLDNADLAGIDFTAEKMQGIKIIHNDQHNPFLLNAREERDVVRRQDAHRKRLTIPRRPPWDEHTTPRELDEREKESLLQWRRGLAELQEHQDLLMTPFERNLEVWRQLWRVIERSTLIVQIVDARDPLLFRSSDLERCVKEVDSGKQNLLLINKADLLTRQQRTAWADYLESSGIPFRFFSAHMARDESQTHDISDKEASSSEVAAPPQSRTSNSPSQAVPDTQIPRDEQVPTSTGSDSRIRVLSVEQVERLFLDTASSSHLQQKDSESTNASQEVSKVTIGLVGYPNVGKSSTINALLGAKRVSVSATPGKTKHFQTIHLSDQIILCDCPGLVFPNFASTKADLVCAGILPIDQQREFRGPAGLVARRIPRKRLEAQYGIRIELRPRAEGGTGVPSASELLSAYARARGFAATGAHGQPDESRAARYILKDYVNGKLLYCHPPPTDPPIDGHLFNADHEERPSTKHVPPRELTEEAETIEDQAEPASRHADQVDAKFFAPASRHGGHLSSPYGFRGGAMTGKTVSGRKQRTLLALERGVDPSEIQLNSKKHHHGRQRRPNQGSA